MARIDNQRRFNKLARQLEPDAQQAFIDSFQAKVNGVSLDELRTAIQDRGAISAVEMLRTTPEDIDLFGAEMAAAFVAGGAIAFGTIPVRQNTPDGTRVNRTFAPRSGDMTAISIQLTRVAGELSSSVLPVVQDVLNEGVILGKTIDERMEELVGRLNPTTGNREGGVIGMNERDARLLQSIDNGFRTGNTARIDSYFDLKSRDVGLDTRIRNALADSGRVSDGLRREIRKRTAVRLLAKRGLTFARAEIYNGIQAGRIAAYDRIVEMGIVEEDSQVKVWEAFIDNNTRPSHVALDGTEVPLDGVFTFTGGDRMSQPRDGSLGASVANIVNCRCYVRITFRYKKF